MEQQKVKDALDKQVEASMAKLSSNIPDRPKKMNKHKTILTKGIQDGPKKTLDEFVTLTKVMEIVDDITRPLFRKNNLV